MLILCPPLIFNISPLDNYSVLAKYIQLSVTTNPLDNYSILAKYIKLSVTTNSCVDLYVPVTDNARSVDTSIIC